MRKFLVFLTSLALMGFVIAPVAAAAPANGAAGPSPEWFIDEEALAFDAMAGATAMWGVHTGAGYRVEVPDNWNGSLVMWAHGFRDGGGLELTVDNHPLREYLIPNGYAWAASSYSANDYSVASGVQDTHALAKFFNGLVGKPDRTYITGASMGGHVTAVSIEQYPTAYDGALPVCGVLGDFELFDYFLDFNVVAQQLGTGSSAFPVDPLPYLFGTVPAIKANLEAFPGGWPVVLNGAGEDLKSLTELRSGGERPNFDEAWFFWNTFPDFQTGPGNFLFDLGATDGSFIGSPGNVVDNTDAVYQFDTDPALSAGEQALNDAVVRVAHDPQGRNPAGLSQVPAILGDPSVPVLTLHNLGDLFVPFHNEIVYAQEVSDNGKSDMLVQRAIRGVNHCGFTGTELATAFAELVAWVEFGIKPLGDVVLDPSAVADPDYGCTFTDLVTPGGHILATPCGPPP